MDLTADEELLPWVEGLARGQHEHLSVLIAVHTGGPSTLMMVEEVKAWHKG